ncbi:helix-turn-helix domain-containing protein [Nocardia sp. NPDC052112]|uniref:winged helix-turn-helix transcriptional regulator n=1 Tax=Nocardia sp. NPDC052112 TaxID=3155646 RepID=UPI00341FA677
MSRALDVLGERWSPLILRDLLIGTTRFNDLARGLPGLSRSLLAKRLRQFERAGLIDKVGSDDLRRYWIVIESGVPSVCDADSGYQVDVTISSDVESLYQVWLGRIPRSHAMCTGRAEFAGRTALTRRIPSVLQLSLVARYSDPAARAS